MEKRMKKRDGMEGKGEKGKSAEKEK